MARALHARLEGKQVCVLSSILSYSSVFNDATRKQLCDKENITFFDRKDLPWMDGCFGGLMFDNETKRDRRRREMLQGFSILEKEYDCLFIDEYPGEVTIIVYSSMYPALVTHHPKKLYYIIQIFRFLCRKERF